MEEGEWGGPQWRIRLRSVRQRSWRHGGGRGVAGAHGVDPAVLGEAVEDPAALDEAVVMEVWRRMRRSRCAHRGPGGGQ
jgi:hypothetical protein